MLSACRADVGSEPVPLTRAAKQGNCLQNADRSSPCLFGPLDYLARACMQLCPHTRLPAKYSIRFQQTYSLKVSSGREQFFAFNLCSLLLAFFVLFPFFRNWINKHCLRALEGTSGIKFSPCLLYAFFLFSPSPFRFAPVFIFVCYLLIRPAANRIFDECFNNCCPLVEAGRGSRRPRFE